MMQNDIPQTPSQLHKQVLVKVNAWVDEGIAPLVDILNSIDSVTTWDSCQGDATTSESAEVYLYCGGKFGDTSVHALAIFADKLAKCLASGGSQRSYVAMEWCDSKQFPWILLTMPSSEIALVTQILSKARGSL